MRKLSIKFKIAGLNIASVFVVVLIFLAIILYQKGEANKNIDIELDKMVNYNMSIISNDIYKQLEILDAILHEDVKNGLSVAHEAISCRGGAVLDASEMVGWEISNQYTSEKKKISAPKMKVGGEWLGQNSSKDTPSPVVDDVMKQVGGFTSIYQKINSNGDMLRISTTIKKKDGTRGIGTYIPAMGTDSDANAQNPIIKTIMAGKTFKHMEFVINAWYLTAYEPLYNGANEIIGAVCYGIPQEKSPNLRNGIMKIRVGKTGYAFVIHGKGKHRGHYVISKDGERDGEDIWESKDSDNRLFIQDIVKKALTLQPGQVGYERYPWVNEGEEPRWKRAAISYYEPWDWVIGVSAYEDDFNDIKKGSNDALDAIVLWGVVTACFSLVAFFLISLILTGKIVNPLSNVVELLKDIAEGEGDLTRRLEIKTEDEVSELGISFNVFVEKLAEIVSRLKDTASGISTVMNDIASQSHDLAERTNEQAASITETSTTLEEFTQSVRSNSESAAETEMMLDSLDNELKSKSGLVANVTETMTDISNSSKKIDNIVNVINDISFQTNLLALNAAVEAARAGEAGRGFAVVASEVRSLAQKTAESSKSIQDIVTNNVEATQKGMELVKQTSDFFNEISGIMADMVKKISDITNSSREQQIGIEQINEAISHLDDVSNQNARLVEALSSSTNGLRSNSAQLEEMVGLFKI